MKVSLFNEAMSLHEAGVGGVVHVVVCDPQGVGMYLARVDGVVHRVVYSTGY